MEREHRRIITDYTNELIKLTNYETLMERCLKQEIMYPIMKSEIEKQSPNIEIRHKLLFEKITRRGPNAFQGLIDICETEFIEAAALLKQKSSRIILNNNDDEFISIRQQRMNQCSRRRIVKDGQNQAKPCEQPRASGIDIDITDKSIPRDDSPKSLELKLYTKEVHPTKSALKVIKSKKFHTHKTLDTYDMRSRHRGVVFLVNIINFRGKRPRNGASVDRDNIITLFRGMEFEIFYYEDITSLEFNTLLDQLIGSQYLQRTDSLVFAVLTHGDSQNGKQYIEFTDGSSTTVQHILNKFNNINCKSMMGKPKIFLFPMCRDSKTWTTTDISLIIKNKKFVSDNFGGVNIWKIRTNGRNQAKYEKGNVSDTGTNIRGKTTEKDSIANSRPNNENIATSSDIKICYATVPGFQTHRDPDTGSWYIQVLCKVFAENAHEDHLDDMLKMIGEETSKIRTVDGELQTTSTEENGFHKHLYFNPGFYGDKF